MSSISSIGSAAGLEAIAARWKQASATTESNADLFKLIDSNGDGALSKDEFGAAAKSASAQSFDLSAQSTQAFAGLRGAPPPDPIASLDTEYAGFLLAALFGLISGAVVAFVWGQLNTPLTDSIYEIIPGFAINLIVAIVVSLATYKPNPEIDAEFDEGVEVSKVK